MMFEAKFFFWAEQVPLPVDERYVFRHALGPVGLAQLDVLAKQAG